jgi:hypothetical protein
MTANRIKSFLKSFIPGYQTLHLEYPVDMKPRYGHGLPAHKLLNEIIDANRETYKVWLVKILSNREYLASIKDKSKVMNSVDPSWNNGFLPGLDIALLYTVFASSNAATYIEIGSGNSTKVAFKAKKDFSLNTQIISIDPAPRTEIDKLADKVIAVPFEKTDLSVFSTLQKNDIVFVDNSHRLFPNSDAMVFFMEVLPSLAPGVLVHIHDIYLPYDYPQDMCDRYYSEQYGLAPFILANPSRYKTTMPNYFVSQDNELASILNPLWEHPSMPEVERHGGSYWIEIGK